MERNLSNIKERLLYYTDIQKITKEIFFKNIGMTYGNFKGIQKNSALNSDAIEKILSIYSDINPTWLITGNGEMLISDDENIEIGKCNLVNVNPDLVNVSAGIGELRGSRVEMPDGVPLLPIDAFAGLGSEMESGYDFDQIEDRYNIPLFKGIHIDFMIPVKGSSMYPKYASGDVVACRLIRELLYIQWNKTYVLDTITNGTMIKRLKPGREDSRILCISDNDQYDAFEIPLSDVRNIALVVGVVRLE